MKLYKFKWDLDYGELVGMFIATENEVNEAIGKELYFGRVLGKYSEIYGMFELKDIEEINLSDAAIEELLHTVGKTVCGYNPLEYIQ